MTENQEIEAAELAIRGLHACAACGRPVAKKPHLACSQCLATAARIKGSDLPSAWTEADWRDWHETIEAFKVRLVNRHKCHPGHWPFGKPARNS